MPRTIALEFRHQNGALAANGSDVVTFLDGRWNRNSQTDHIWRKIAELRKLRSKYNDQHFVGYTILGTGDYARKTPHVSMSDPNPPEWVPSVPGRNPALWR